jgi:S-adenosylmethionine hydrolase
LSSLAHLDLAMARDKRCVVTLTTDFGMEDGNVGVMKGVILGLNPDVSIVDLSHDIPPQGLAHAAYVLRRAYAHFPPGTIHVVVVDPGVGTERRAIALHAGSALFVAPDNGVLTYVLSDLGSEGRWPHIVHLTEPQYWLPQVSSVFHGRDIFAPVAGHLSLGLPIDDLGPPIDDPVTLPPPRLQHSAGQVGGQIMHVDHFGNLLTNIPGSDLAELGQHIVTRIDAIEIIGLSRTFGQGRPGDLIAYVDSSGHLAIAVVNGSAQALLHRQVGQPVDVVALESED